MKRYNLVRTKLSPDITHSGPVVGTRVALPDYSFSVVPPIAGASDAMGRISLAYNVITTHFDLPFLYEPYWNYHSADFDFDRAFGIQEHFNVQASETDSEGYDKITLSDVIESILAGERPFLEPRHYRVTPNLYGNHELVKALRLSKGLSETFFSKLTYRPTTNPFSSDTKRRKVVIHLRRQDIAGEMVFRGVPPSQISKEQSKGLHSRPLLHLDTALEILNDEMGSEEEIDLVIASDGMDQIAKRFGRQPEILRNIERIEEEVRGPLPKTSLNISNDERIVGGGPEVTARTMDAMYLADLVITSSSSFPRLPCRFGGASIISVEFEK
jgi:hypothetical protein